MKALISGAFGWLGQHIQQTLWQGGLVRAWGQATLLRWLGSVLLLAALSMAVWQAYLALAAWSEWQVKEVEIVGLRGNVDLQGLDVQSVSTVLRQSSEGLHGGAWLSMKPAVLQAQLGSVPWVRRAVVRRVWPNRVLIVIEQHQPIARLNDAGYLNQQGEAFSAPSEGREAVLAGLPLVLGDKGAAGLLSTRLRDLNTWIAPLQLQVRGLELSSRRAWSAILSNDLRVDMGRDDLKESPQVRVTRWVSTWGVSKNEAKMQEPKHIDLRHMGGYAVSQ